jgi:hypothetical protein
LVRAKENVVLSWSSDLLGWVGGGLVAVAYVQVSTRRIVPDAWSFQGLNVVGATLLGIAAFNSGALPNACMNIAWILFGAQSLVTTNRRRRAASAPARREEFREAETDPIGLDLAGVARGAA